MQGEPTHLEIVPMARERPKRKEQGANWLHHEDTKKIGLAQKSGVHNVQTDLYRHKYGRKDTWSYVIFMVKGDNECQERITRESKNLLPTFNRLLSLDTQGIH